jgi:pimeloyl-ACP methyl ester carboxylesterase
MTEPYHPRRPPEFAQREFGGVIHHLHVWPGDDPPIVLLHGFMDCGATFQFVVDELATRRKLIAPDWRGFGRSGWARDGYWFPQYLADLEALLDAYAPESIDLVGHSMGGNIALAYAGVRPDRVRRVVTLEGFGLSGAPADAAPGRYGEWLDQLRRLETPSVFPSLAVLADVLRKRNHRLTPERAAFVAQAWAETLDDGRARLRFDPAHRRVNPVLYRREEAEACWRRIVAPVAYVAGADSDFLERLHGAGDPQRMRALIPQLEACVVEGSGHMLHHDQPASVAAIIDAFLDRTVA